MIMFKNVLLPCLLLALSACATSPAPLNSLELMAKTAQCFGDPSATIYSLPSRGGIADKLAINAARSSGNDGGFSVNVKKQIARGDKKLVFYSSNSEKTSVFLQLALAQFQKNELDGIGICYVGERQYADAIAQAVHRTGASFHFEGNERKK